jgi:hypothetical protein
MKKRISTFKNFLNEGKWDRYFPSDSWVWGEDEVENREECIDLVATFLGTDLEFMDVSFDPDYSEGPEIDPIGEEIFDHISSDFKLEESQEWEGDGSNYYGEFECYQSTKHNLRVIIEKGDCGWNFGPHNSAEYTRLIMRKNDYEFLSSDPGLVSKFFKDPEKYKGRRGAKEIGLL